MKLPSVFLHVPVLLLTAAVASAESHPSWWSYASPDATAMVGIQWENLRNSPFASAIEAELSSSGPLAFPSLDCLRQARQIVISAPELLAAEAGSFPAATVKDQAQRAGLHRVVYRNVTLWMPDAAASLGIAQVSDQLVLVGTRKTLQGALDRTMSETGRQYSPLLPRAAKFSQTGDLWVVAVKLPDPLANLFVPIDAAGSLFLGQISVRDGLMMEASFDAPSSDAAAQIAAKLQEQAQSLPEFARGLKAASDRRTVNITLEASREELAAALRSAPIAPVAVAAAPAAQPAVAKPAPVIAAKPAPPAAPPAPTPVVKPAPVAIAEAKAPEVPKPVEAKPVEVKPAPPTPQVVRISGLDGGPREIVLPPLP